jgi:Condensation domain
MYGPGAGDFVGLSCNQALRLALAYGEDQWLQPPARFAVRICAPVDQDALARALAMVARRHSALRTFFPADSPSGLAVCMHPDHAQWPMLVADGGGDAPAGREALEWLRRPFSPGRPPLLRAVLIRQDSNDWLLGLAVDHLNFDGGSIPVILRDLSAAWQQLATGAGDATPPGPAVPYECFVRWEADWLARMGGQALAYWTPRWEEAGLFPSLQLPVRQDVPEAGQAGRVWERALELSGIRRAAEQIGAGYFSPFMLVAAALFWVMKERFGVVDHGLHFAFSNRRMPGSDQAIGYYSNRLLLRVVTARQASFPELATATRSAAALALKYGSLPYGLISERLFPAERSRRPSQRYLFLNIQPEGQVYAVPGGTARLVSISRPDEVFNPGLMVDCGVDDTAGTMVLRCAYRSAFYTERTVDAFMSEVAARLGADTG